MDRSVRWSEGLSFRVCLPFTKRFPENPVETWMAHDFLCRSRWKISGSNGTSEKVVLFSRTEYSKRKFVFHFFKAIFSTSFRPSRSFLGVWNWFVQMVNAILGRILPVMNFTYHLPKPSTHRFAHVNGKQPKLSEKSNFETPDGVPTKAPSTRIRFSLNPQLFLYGYKNFHDHTYPDSNRICLSTRTYPDIFESSIFFFAWTVLNIYAKELGSILWRQ